LPTRAIVITEITASKEVRVTQLAAKTIFCLVIQAAQGVSNAPVDAL
jgi:hypothetical protein